MAILDTSSGSRWRRWDPHVHAPGTVHNDQFKGVDPWEAYLAALESTNPAIEVIGITDYYSIETYKRLVVAKSDGRIPDCSLIFPNIEMRLALGTATSNFVNIHLLVCPDDPNHLDQVERILGGLVFEAFDDRFGCTTAELMRLGRRVSNTQLDDIAALKLGSEQFKIPFEKLKDVFKSIKWARDNIIVAVASGNDGTSGLRDGADATLRKEIEKFAHAIFASSPKARDFWIGKGVHTIHEIRQHYGALKPCLHGSDAHDHAAVGAPALNRYCWIKGNPTFDALRQACIDPEGRAFVGENPPVAASASQIISEIEIANATWVQPTNLILNPGLIAIIGARGSGKTALAEIIAAGCDAVPAPAENHQSFLYRARQYLASTAVTLTWNGTGKETTELINDTAPASDTYPRARFLSQQFVEKLCAADGMTDELLKEVERVVYDAHSVNDRDGAVNFDDLLDLRATRFRQARVREELSLAAISERISAEMEKDKLLTSYQTQVNEKTAIITRLTDDRSKLVTKDSAARVTRLDGITKAAEQARSNVRYFNRQEQQLLTLRDEVDDVRTNKTPESLRGMKDRHSLTGITDDADWAPFALDFKGDVDALMADRIAKAQKNSTGWKGAPVTPSQDINTPIITDDADLKLIALAALEAEIARLSQLVSVDRLTTERFAAISQKIVTENETLKGLTEKLEDAKGARERARLLREEREQSYVRVFQAVIAEQDVLNSLYAPIKSRLAAATGTLNKLSFAVSRTADVEKWAFAGEQLLDLRTGPFKGKGAIAESANAMLKTAWETGTAEQISDAMRAFREQHDAFFIEHAIAAKNDQTGYRDWSRRLAQWLYGTNHISIKYSVDYDGIDIRNLSPGTRGIVLLLLYLALDDADDRPLIIDQPEENLDPKSIYDELVGLFVKAKAKRQVIMVTHNANLVVNADADQIIVATVGPHIAGSLPPISYRSGGLDDAAMRTAVCDILEGGEEAFKERARRLRVHFE